MNKIIASYKSPDYKKDLWEKLWEWETRIVYKSKTKKNIVYKIPKNEIWIVNNKLEYRTFIEQHLYQLKWWKVKDPVAKCVLLKDDVLSMEYVEPIWWRVWKTLSWEIKTYDLE